MLDMGHGLVIQGELILGGESFWEWVLSGAPNFLVVNQKVCRVLPDAPTAQSAPQIQTLLTRCLILSLSFPFHSPSFSFLTSINLTVLLVPFHPTNPAVTN